MRPPGSVPFPTLALAPAGPGRRRPGGRPEAEAVMPRARGCRGDSGPVGPVGPAPAHPPEHGGSELSDGHGGVRVRPCVEIVGLTGQVAPELLRLVLAAATLWTDDQAGASAGASGASAGGAVRPRRRLTGQGLRGGAVGWVGLGLDGEGVG